MLSLQPCRRPRAALLYLAILASTFTACTSSPPPAHPGAPSVEVDRSTPPLPWEDWKDLNRIAQLHTSSRVELRSSFCPDGCRFDRHSSDQQRFIAAEAGENVIFDESGPGAITRIWMTSGDKRSIPLSSKTRIRFYFDNAPTPTIDLPLVALFDGSTEPFTSPLAEHRKTASGGNYVLVPMPYRERCRVTLSNVEDERLWFQFHFHRGRHDLEVTSFELDGIAERLAPLRSMLAASGRDPWPRPAGQWATASDQLEPGQFIKISSKGPATITAVELTADRSRWNELELTLNIDGILSRVKASDMFASPDGDTRFPGSLFLSKRTSGGPKPNSASLFLPMPHRRRATIEVRSTAVGGDPIEVTLRRRRDVGPVAANAGALKIKTIEDQTGPNRDLKMVSTSTPTKWVGTYADLGAARPNHTYLEGDERLLIDHGRHPVHYGTGTEDYYAGGFYFDKGPYAHALSGMLLQDDAVQKESASTSQDGTEELDSRPARTVMYRWMLTDAPSSRGALVADLEAGPTGVLPMTARHTTFLYIGPPQATAWKRVDVFEAGKPEDRAEHQYSASTQFSEVSLRSRFEGISRQQPRFPGIERGPGVATFTLDATTCGPDLRLRRIFDAATAGQSANVQIQLSGPTGEGSTAGARVPYSAPNTDRRWAEIDLDFRLEPAGLKADAEPDRVITVTVDALADNPTGTFTEFAWELWCQDSSLTFRGGFEAGNAASWE